MAPAPLLFAAAAAAVHRVRFTKTIRKDTVGYNGELAIGTPPQKLTVLLDVGSNHLHITSALCRSPGCQGHNLYDHNKSSTYRANGTAFNYRHGMGAFVGYFSQDDVTLDGLPAKGLLFGEDVSCDGIDFQNEPYHDGIMGLMMGKPNPRSPDVHVPNIITLFKDQGVTDSYEFGYVGGGIGQSWEENLPTGTFVVGGVDTSLIKAGAKIQYFKIDDDESHWNLDDVVGFADAPGQYHAGVDTGTPIILGSAAACGAAVARLEAVYDRSAIAACPPLAPLPTLNFTVKDGFSVSIAPEDYVVRSTSAGGCYLKYDAGGEVAKVGAVACTSANGTCSCKKDTDIQNSGGGSSIVAETEEGCCRACSFDAQCRAAVFLPPSGVTCSYGIVAKPVDEFNAHLQKKGYGKGGVQSSASAGMPDILIGDVFLQKVYATFRTEDDGVTRSIGFAPKK